MLLKLPETNKGQFPFFSSFSLSLSFSFCIVFVFSLSFSVYNCLFLQFGQGEFKTPFSLWNKVLLGPQYSTTTTELKPVPSAQGI
jgi:hypothetical protein